MLITLSRSTDKQHYSMQRYFLSKVKDKMSFKAAFVLTVCLHRAVLYAR